MSSFTKFASLAMLTMANPQPPAVEKEKLSACAALNSSLEVDVERKTLGAGGNARIYHATWNGEPAAIKLTPTHEGMLSKKLRHVNIIHTHEYVALDDKEGCQVMEVLKSGSLKKWLNNQSEDFYDEETGWCRGKLETAKCIAIAKRLTLQILEGTKAMHAQSIAHRDLKLDNVMLSNEAFAEENISDMVLEDFNAKIIDFGLSKEVHSPKEHLDCKGTPGYIAPECFMTWADSPVSQGYNMFHADTFAIGKIFENIITTDENLFPFQPVGFMIQREFTKSLQNEVVPTAWPLHHFGIRNKVKMADFKTEFWMNLDAGVVALTKGMQEFSPENRTKISTAIAYLTGAEEDVSGSPKSSPALRLSARRNGSGSPVARMLRRNASQGRLSPRRI